MQGIIAFILIFFVVVTISDFGHFIVAKRSGILCQEFAIGMGPKIFHKKIGETNFTIRLLPVGGYVKMPDNVFDFNNDMSVYDLKKGMKVSLKLDENDKVEKICAEIDGLVVPANYNCPGQLVISGETPAVEKACEALKAAGAKRALLLPVNGAFHSPLMQPAQEKLAQAIEGIKFNNPILPIYQNVTTTPVTDPEEIKKNLIAQLTGPVKWTQTIQNMVKDGADHFVEVGPGKTLQGLIKKISPSIMVSSGI